MVERVRGRVEDDQLVADLGDDEITSDLRLRRGHGLRPRPPSKVTSSPHPCLSVHRVLEAA